jgi:hypothetical protein
MQELKHVLLVVTTKSSTYTNCGKIDRSMETCNNRKKEVVIVATAIVKSMKLVVGTKTQLVKSRKIHVGYPYIICFSVEHR